MFRLRLLRNLKSALWLLIVALIPTAIAGLYWANKTGLPEEWRKAIEQEISNHGAHVEIGSLTYVPLKGFLAENVRVFAERERTHEISRLEQAQIVLDHTKLARGEFRLKKIELNNARLSLPVDPKNPAGEALDFSGIHGTIFMTADRLIEIPSARAEVGGIKLTVTAKILGEKHGHGDKDEKHDGKRREMIAHIINHLESWTFDHEALPELHVDLTGDISDRSKLNATFRLEAPSVAKNQYRLNHLTAQGSLSGHLLTVNSFQAEDSRGTISGHADYQILTHEGRFDVDSTIDLPRLLKSWLDAPMNLDVLFGGTQTIEALGDFNLENMDDPVVHLTGHASCESLMFRGVSFDSLETWFSWQEGDLFLRDLTLTRPDGVTRGKALKKRNILQIGLHTTLPATLYKPFFAGQPLEKIIADVTEHKDASTEIHLEGSTDLDDPKAWAYRGNGDVKNISYRGVPVKSANFSFNVSAEELDFRDGSVTFDYTDYPLREAFGGPAEGTAAVARIRYDAGEHTVTVADVVGEIWAAPLVRLFAPATADNLEQYRFHRPPMLNGSGLIDVTPQGRTNLTVGFSTPHQADYLFLGKNLTLTAPSATVTIRDKEVRVDGLTLQAFDGPISAEFIHSGDSVLSGEMNWTDLSMAGVSSTYGFGMKGGGLLTGRIDFSITKGDISTMQGKGLLALEDAMLFSVPIFGPLSKVMAAVLNRKGAGFQMARSAFCTFEIHDGIARTHDFHTATNSITFAGEGAVDLKERELDFTIRLNARGLLGLITLPLRPFTGLFQFRGTGPLQTPKWENVGFTDPPEKQKRVLLAPPPRALIVPE